MSVPTKIFFTKGSAATASSLLVRARAAGRRIQKYNLVQVSSIFPPKCRIVKKEEA